MMTTRYTALSFLSLLTLILGLAALAAPAPYRGPMLVPVPADLPVTGTAVSLGLSLLRQPIYLADVVGLALLVVATLSIWAIAILWEVRRHRVH